MYNNISQNLNATREMPLLPYKIFATLGMIENLISSHSPLVHRRQMIVPDQIVMHSTPTVATKSTGYNTTLGMIFKLVQLLKVTISITYY